MSEPDEPPGDSSGSSDGSGDGAAAELARANAALSEEMRVRARIEEELRHRDRFLESVFEHVPDMIFLKDAQELRFVRVNRAFEELTGLPRAELLGKSDHDFFPADEADFFTRSDREVLASGALRDIPAESVHTRERGVLWLHTKKIPIRGESGEPLFLLGISEDITERRRAEEDKRRTEEELRQSAFDLARSNEELEQFAYVASHDLQEPLRKIQAFSNLLTTQHGDALGAEGRDYLGRILGAAGRMRTLIQDLLTLSRITSHARPFEPVDLGAIAQGTLTDLELQIAETGATVKVGALPTLPADPGQMRQLFQNLVGNALKFRREGASPRVEIASQQHGALHHVTFTDDGIGFDDKYADRIWKPFQRLHARERYPGTGIGLAICRKIVERHGGNVQARGAPGSGATFVVMLPAAPAPTEPEPEAER